jgi:hypothetical protein
MFFRLIIYEATKTMCQPYFIRKCRLIDDNLPQMVVIWQQTKRHLISETLF